MSAGPPDQRRDRHPAIRGATYGAGAFVRGYLVTLLLVVAEGVEQERVEFAGWLYYDAQFVNVAFGETGLVVNYLRTGWGGGGSGTRLPPRPGGRTARSGVPARVGGRCERGSGGGGDGREHRGRDCPSRHPRDCAVRHGWRGTRPACRCSLCWDPLPGCLRGDRWRVAHTTRAQLIPVCEQLRGP